MNPALALLSWWVAFAGSHLLLSHPPVRSTLAGRLGERAFQGMYSVVALATFIPLVRSFFGNRVSHAVPLPVLLPAPGMWWATMLLMLAAVLLIVLGFSKPNPLSSFTARPGAGALGVLRITRHPAFMGTAIFGFAHLLVNTSTLDRTFFGGLLAFALIGSAHQDWRKRLNADEETRRFFSETSFLPFGAILSGRNRLEPRELSPAAIVVGLIVFAAIFLFHHRLFG